MSLSRGESCQWHIFEPQVLTRRAATRALLGKVIEESSSIYSRGKVAQLSVSGNPNTRPNGGLKYDSNYFLNQVSVITTLTESAVDFSSAEKACLFSILLAFKYGKVQVLLALLMDATAFENYHLLPLLTVSCAG